MPPAETRTATIRGLRPSDRPAIVRLDAVHTGESKPAYWARLCQDILGTGGRKTSVGLVATVDGALVGFVFAVVRAFEFGSEPCGWIVEIGVDPGFTRQHIASDLLAEACRRLRARGVSTIRTMVRRNDVPVLTFFRTNGFAGGPYVQLEMTWDPASPAGRA